MSKLVAKILEGQMARGDDYSDAHRRWRQLMTGDSLRLAAKKRLTREEVNARR